MTRAPLTDRRLWPLLVVLALAAGGCLEEGDESLVRPLEAGACAVDTTRTEIDYQADIMPIFEQNGCIACHTAGAGGFDITALPDAQPEGVSTGGAVVVPCDPEASSLYTKLSPGCSEAPFGDKMPPGSEGIDAAEAALVQQWIEEGARATYDPAACP